MYLDDVYRLALSITSNEADAADVCQETFIKLSQSRRSFESDVHLKNWLLKVCANEARSRLRTFWKRSARSLEAAPEASEEPEQSAGAELMAAMTCLDKAERALIALPYFHGYFQKDIGKMLHLSQGAVTTRLYRAQQKLKKELETGGKTHER